MSLITRCPACKTLFKVVPDQLRVSEGWVRCGQCSEIFDASAHLQGSELADVDAQALARQSSEEAGPQTEQPLDVDLSDNQGSGASLMEVGVPSGMMGLEHGAYDPLEPVMGEPLLSQQSSSAPVDPFRSPRDTEPQELGFMKRARAAARWQRPWVRAALFLTALALGLGLLFQWSVQERDRIAAAQPGLKPWLESVCAIAQCAVAPLRQIESVVIDSSSFNKLRGDVYRLNFLLKNTASIELALPAVELSLTDTKDESLLRRVFQPGELGLKQRTLPPSSETNVSLTLGIKTNGNSERVAGYRILAFYP